MRFLPVLLIACSLASAQKITAETKLTADFVASSGTLVVKFPPVFWKCVPFSGVHLCAYFPDDSPVVAFVFPSRSVVLFSQSGYMRQVVADERNYRAVVCSDWCGISY
jgi:hypothetical protein